MNVWKKTDYTLVGLNKLDKVGIILKDVQSDWSGLGVFGS